MDTGFGKAEATSPNYGQPSIGIVPKLWTIDFLRNPESWTFQFQMDILRNPKLWTVPVFSKIPFCGHSRVGMFLV